MKILWLLVVLQTALGQPGFGRSYLRNSRLCHQWSCINAKLNTSDSLPTAVEFGEVLRRLLPPEWHHVVDRVVNTCYNDRPRRYTNTCPGQAVMHCAVDQLIENCPESSLRKGDACAPVNSIAGFKNMFTQSRYENQEKNMALERRPSWFIKNYFNAKCCNLPELFNASILSECGLSSVIQYYVHDFQPKFPTQGVWPSQKRVYNFSAPVSNGDSLQVVTFKSLETESDQGATDPLDCCDISEFIQPSWRQDCNFQLNWDVQRRLVIKNDTPAVTTDAPTSTNSPVIRNDVTMVPQSCEKESCVFNKLNIISPTGAVDIDAFGRLLDNFTNNYPSWNSAKGRVMTTCLRRSADYGAECEINKILACTFDVLTENCPNAKRNDLCKHTTSIQRTCQISSSKYRPKHRREICTLPELVDQTILTECGLTSLSRKEPVTTVLKPKTYRLFTSTSKCHDHTPSTTCIMSKMGILNKYGFMDYLKIKQHLRRFTSQNDWSTHEAFYLNGFNISPLYREHCNSPKKFFNLVDSIVMTCPQSKRKNTTQCVNMFNLISNTPVSTDNASPEHTQQILNHYASLYTYLKPNIYRPAPNRKVKKTPTYNYGILDNGSAPKVTIIDLKPKADKVTVKPPLVLVPVYTRIPHTNLVFRQYEDESSFTLHNRIAQAHMSTPYSLFTATHGTTSSSTRLTPTTSTASIPITAPTTLAASKPIHVSTASSTLPTPLPNSTPNSYSTPSPFLTTPTHQPISTSQQIFPPTFAIPLDIDSKFEMIKPE